MIRILIVDDDANQRSLYREILGDDGFETVEAGNGREALEEVRRQRPDVVILDINMPGMDGLQLLRHLHDFDNRLPVILNSAYSAYRNQYVSWLADAYLIKTSNIDEVRSTVRRVLEQRGVMQKRCTGERGR